MATTVVHKAVIKVDVILSTRLHV